MDDCCGLPFVTPVKSKSGKSLKDIAKEIKNGTTKEYQGLSNLYNLTMKSEDKDEEVS